MISIDRVFPSSDKAKMLFDQTSLALSLVISGTNGGNKVYLNSGFGLFPLLGNPFIHNTSFIHEISLSNQEVRYLLTSVDYSESLKCVKIINRFSWILRKMLVSFKI